MATKTSTGLIAYCEAQLGRPYWMGTFGQIAAEWLYKANKARLPQYYTAADFPAQYGQRVHDCIGLVKGYLWSDGPDSAPKYLSGALKQDLDANGMYYACKQRGGISSMPDTPGALVFICSGGKMVHIGVYIGDGQCIEARGHAYGVVQTALKGRGWTHWGLCPYITYGCAGGGTGSEDKMTEEERYAEWKKFESRRAEEVAKSGTYDEAAKAMNKAKTAGVMDGTRPCSPVTRGELAIAFDRKKLID